MEEHAQLIDEAYAAFNRRDVEGVLRWMRSDVDWPNAADGSRVRGHDEVRAYWLEQWQHADPHVEPVKIARDDTWRTVVNVHQVVRDLEGKVLVDEMVQHVFVIGGGLIERMDIRR